MAGGGGGAGQQLGGVAAVQGRAEIDTRAPFRSVKEAVALFGEKVLAGELSAGRRSTVNENRAVATRPTHHATVAAVPSATAAAGVSVHPHPAPRLHELVEARQELEREREEKQRMAGCIQTLQDELSHAVRELQRLKERDGDEAAATKVIDLQVDDADVVKFVEERKKHPLPDQLGRGASAEYDNSGGGNAGAGAGDGDGDAAEVQKKRYVTFADPPTADVVMELHSTPPQPHYYYREPRFQRQMSAGHEPAVKGEDARKKKKKPLIPLVGALFMRRKKSSSGGCRHEAPDN